MGVFVSHSHRLYNPDIRVMIVSSFCAWIWISAISECVYAEGNQTVAMVTIQVSSGILATKADDEAGMGVTESNSNTSSMTTITLTNTTGVDSHLGIANTESNPYMTSANLLDVNSTNVTNDVDTHITESTPNMTTTNTSDNSSSESVENTPKLSTQTPVDETETASTRSDVIINISTTEAATKESLYSTRAITMEVSYVTNNSELTTTTYQNTSKIKEQDHTTKVHRPSSLGFLIIICVAVTAVVAVILVIALVIYYNRDRCCQPKRQAEEEYVDCDQELYTNLNVYANFRHHGARAEYQPLSLKDEKLITKMETDEVDDDNCTDNTVIDVVKPADPGRFLTPEGLVYVTLEHECNNGKTRASKHKDDTTVQYASLDIHKTNKLFDQLQKRENNKKSKKAQTKKKMEKTK